jgi:glutathione peroxidase
MARLACFIRTNGRRFVQFRSLIPRPLATRAWPKYTEGHVPPVSSHLERPMTKTKLFALSLAAIAVLFAAAAPAGAEEKEASVLDRKMSSLEGKEVDLAKYKGKVVLIVNVASECGLTPQYKDLQALHQQYADKGLAVLGFPCNQFGSQEPGSASEIREFCTANYGVKFDMFAKVDVNGEGQCDLYKQLTMKEAGAKFPGKITWNFEKFVIGRSGEVVARFAPRTKPNDKEVLAAIEKELSAK